MRVRRKEENRMTAIPKPQRCVFCAYIGKIHMKTVPVVPWATEIVETPNGPRALCAKHARDAVRATDPICIDGDLIPKGKS